MARTTINPNIRGGGQAPNIHPQKGIAYGTIYGNKVPELMEHIIECGTDTTYQEKRDEIAQQIRNAVSRANQKIDEVLDNLREKVCADLINDLDEFINDDDGDIITTNVSIDLNFEGEDELIDAYMETWECDEPTYRLEEDGFVYEMSYLGGAPIIFVLDAPIVTFAHRCSPCVPNGGDLSTPSSFERDEGTTVWYPLSGICCFAIDPGWFETKPYKIRKIDDDGNVTGEWE